jgi:hypothetical protein
MYSLRIIKNQYMDEYKNNILHKIKIYVVSYFPLFYIFEDVKVGDFSSITQVFSQNKKLKKASPAIVQISSEECFCLL